MAADEPGAAGDQNRTGGPPADAGGRVIGWAVMAAPPAVGWRSHTDAHGHADRSPESRRTRSASSPTAAVSDRAQGVLGGGEPAEDLVLGDAGPCLDRAGVEIGDDRHGRIAERQLPGERRLGHPGHPDDRRSPAAACHRDSAREEKRGPLMTTSVPPSVPGNGERATADTSAARPRGQ